MAERVKIWLDPEADFLEVTFSDDPGYNYTPLLFIMCIDGEQP